MSVPSEIRKLLGDRQPTAHASLSSSFQGPIGETHFVVADGQLFVFQRESLIGEFEPVVLDPAHTPKLVPGTFNDELHVALADGSSHELQVSTFDRDAITKVLEENASVSRPAPTHDEDLPVKAEAPEEEKSSDELMGDLQAATDKSQQSDDNALERIDLRKLESPTPLTEPHTPPPKQNFSPRAAVDEDEAREQSEALKDSEAQKAKNIYHGSDPGCTGCLIQTVIFFGGIVAMWFAHEHAMLNIGVVEPTDTYDESPVFVITKIVAVIAGMYLGGKTASIVGGIFRKLNWTGWVAFVKDRAVAIGQRGKWQIVIDSGQPFQFEGGAHSSIEASTGKDGKPTKRSFSVFVRIIQDGKFFTLKTSISRAGHPESVSSIPLKPLSEDWKDQRMITMDNKTFRQVLKRLQDWQ